MQEQLPRARRERQIKNKNIQLAGKNTESIDSSFIPPRFALSLIYDSFRDRTADCISRKECTGVS
jgi:hypothetical protein